MHVTDAELVTRAAAGERAAFERLHDRHVDTVHDHLVRWCRDPALAADATQEAFVALLPRLGDLRDGQAVLAWLLRTARNRAIDQLRRTRRERSTSPLDDGGIPTDVLTAVATDRQVVPHAAAESAEAARLVWSVAAGLDERTFSVLDLHVRQGLDASEIAEVLGTSRSNANQLVHRMRDRMRTLFGAVVLIPSARADCPRLAALADAAGDPLALADARAIEAHADDCPTCEPARRRAVAPLRAYGALAQVRAPAQVHAGVATALDAHFGGGASGTVRRGLVGAVVGLLLLLGGTGALLALPFGAGADTAAPVPRTTATDAPVGEDANNRGEDTVGAPASPEPTEPPSSAEPDPTADDLPTDEAVPPTGPSDASTDGASDGRGTTPSGVDPGEPDGPAQAPSPTPRPSPAPGPTTPDPTGSPSPPAPEPSPTPDASPSPTPTPPASPRPTPPPPPADPLGLTIVRPAAATRVPDGAAVGLAATVSGGAAPTRVTWRSDRLPGQVLLTGPTGTAQLPAFDCADTTHRVTATGVDAAGTTAADTVTVVVLADCADPLVAAVLRPASGTRVTADQAQRDGSWTGTVGVLGDATGGEGELAYTWSVGGAVVTKGAQASVPVSVPGCEAREVTIRLTVVDAAGATASNAVTVLVVPACLR